MGLLDWFKKKEEPEPRVFVDPAQLAPTTGPWMAALPGQQPAHEDLLRENTGVADIATRALANRMSSLNFEVYRKVEVEGRLADEVITNHPLVAMLERPNPTFTMAQMLRLTTQYVVTVGEAYWMKVRTGLGTPGQLDVVPPSMMEPVVSQNVVDGYVMTDADGAQRDYPADAFVRFFFPDPESPFSSEGYLGPNARVADIMKFEEQTMAKFFENNGMPPASIQAKSDDAVMPDGDQLAVWKELWIQKYHQRRGTHMGVPAWLPPGWEIVMHAMQSGKDITPLLEYLTTNQLMNFGVPRSVLGLVQSGDRSSAETNQFVMDLHSVTPIADLISSSLTMQLAGEFSDDLHVRFQEFVSRNQDNERAQESHDLTHKIKSINHVRDARGDEEVEWGDLPVGNQADRPYTGEEPEPLDFGTPPDIAETTSDEDEDAVDSSDDDDDRKARALHFFSPEIAWARQVQYEDQFGGAYRREMRRIFRIQERKTLQRYKAYGEQQRIKGEDLFNTDEWYSLFERRLQPIVVSIYRRVGGAVVNQLTPSSTFVFTQAVIDHITRERDALADRVNNTTLLSLDNVIETSVAAGESVDQTAARIRSVFADASVSRSRTIARTEVLKANQQAQMDGFSQSGVVRGKQWNTSRDGRVRDSHIPLDGVRLPINEDFSVAGEPARMPGDTRLSTGNLINCRCFVTPILDDEEIEQ